MGKIFARVVTRGEMFCGGLELPTNQRRAFSKIFPNFAVFEDNLEQNDMHISSNEEKPNFQTGTKQDNKKNK